MPARQPIAATDAPNTADSAGIDQVDKPVHAGGERVSSSQSETKDMPRAAADPARGSGSGSGFDHTLEYLEATGPSKQTLDVALAVELIENGRISERELAKVLGDWSVFGHLPLGEYLVNRNVLRADERSKFEALATESLRHSQTTPANGGGGPTTSDSNFFQRGNNSRVAKLLGLSQHSQAPADDATRGLNTNYRLLRKLGQGGLGSVWLARDNQLKRSVAIKEITIDDPSRSALQRFRREAELTGQLEHPNIVSIYQFGEDEQTGRPFYAMRFVGKTTLADAITEYHEKHESGFAAPMELHRLLSAFLSVCQAIGFAHSRGVIHRDLKPENVALDSFGQVIVIDWGLAKAGDAELDESAGRIQTGADAEETHEGQVLGTPLYMSPEQAAGRLEEIDERTDIYGLGAILFSILTGMAPHEKSYAALSSNSQVSQLITAIVSSETPKPSEIDSAVDPDLEGICLRAMAKRRYARYESASDLADDVQRWMAGVTTKKAQFEEMRSQVRELEMQIRSIAKDLGKDVRFMANLPPIQGLVTTRSSTSGEPESEEVWRQRLSSIYDGLLRANSEYLAVAFTAAEDDQQLREVVRVERHSSDPMYVRQVPKSRLACHPIDGPIAETLQMHPGEVKLCGNARVQPGEDCRTEIKRLLAATPVYDETHGEPFGIVLIETDMRQVARQLFETLNIRTTKIDVADNMGRIWISNLRDRDSLSDECDQSALQLRPELAPLYDPGEPKTVVTDERSFIAKKVWFDNEDRSSFLVLILSLQDD